MRSTSPAVIIPHSRPSHLLSETAARHLPVQLSGVVAIVVLTLVLAPLNADVVTDRNAALTRFFAKEGTVVPLHQQVRTYAILHLAMHSAIVSAQSTEREHPHDAAVIAGSAAAQVVFDRLLGSAPDDIPIVTRGAAAPKPPEVRWAAIGRSAAAEVLDRRIRDGWPVVTRPGRLSAAELLAPAAAAPKQVAPAATWDTAKPFALKRAVQFAPDPPYCVYADGAVMPNEHLRRKGRRLGIALAPGRPEPAMQDWRVNPCASWNRLLSAATHERADELAARAAWFALLNAALADAFLCVAHWNDIYGSGFTPEPVDLWWRQPLPEPGQPDLLPPSNWKARPMPHYPAIGAALAGAAQPVLTRVLGDGSVPIPLAPLHVDETRSPASRQRYPSITAAALDCAAVHELDIPFGREACIAGYDLGLTIGDYVATRARNDLLTVKRRR